MFDLILNNIAQCTHLRSDLYRELYNSRTTTSVAGQVKTRQASPIIANVFASYDILYSIKQDIASLLLPVQSYENDFLIKGRDFKREIVQFKK